jgi:hypothetical protein
VGTELVLVVVGYVRAHAKVDAMRSAVIFGEWHMLRDQILVLTLQIDGSDVLRFPLFSNAHLGVVYVMNLWGTRGSALPVVGMYGIGKASFIEMTPRYEYEVSMH